MEVLEAAAKAPSDHLPQSAPTCSTSSPITPRRERQRPGRRRNGRSAARWRGSIGDWELEDPNPRVHRHSRRDGPDSAPIDPAEAEPESGCEPEIIVKMALELDCLGPSVFAAAGATGQSPSVGPVAGLLEAPPQTETAGHSGAMSPPRAAGDELADPPDQEVVAVEGLVLRLGAAAANSAARSPGDRGGPGSTRAALMKQLLALVGRVRASGSRPATRRSLVPPAQHPGADRSLWAAGPEGFSPLSYARHADPRIRREGIKLLLESSRARGRRSSAWACRPG